MNAPASNYERFLQRVADLGTGREYDAALYRRLKDELYEQCKDISTREYDAALKAIVKAAGV